MIEKLKRPVKIGGTTFREKINELVDAVNELQKQYDSVCVWVGEQKLNYNPDTTKGLSTLVEEPEPTDPYAEQRKWIGSLVEYKIGGDYYYGILTDIKDGYNPPFVIDNNSYTDDVWLPDESVIYKGGNNE